MKISEMNELLPKESKRTYHFPKGEKVYIENITHLSVSASGTHRLKSEDGMLHIIPTGWIYIKIQAEDWTI